MNYPRLFPKMRRDWLPYGALASNQQGFPAKSFRARMTPEGVAAWSESPPDFGLHFFLYLRRDFLYYFR